MLFVALLAATAVTNLINDFPTGWELWSAHANLAPEASAQGKALRMRCPRFESYGKWIATVPAVQPGRAYQFDVLFRTENVANEDVSVAAILTWHAASGKGLVQRDYADAVSDAGDRTLDLAGVDLRIRAPDHVADRGEGIEALRLLVLALPVVDEGHHAVGAPVVEAEHVLAHLLRRGHVLPLRRSRRRAKAW